MTGVQTCASSDLESAPWPRAALLTRECRGTRGGARSTQTNFHFPLAGLHWPAPRHSLLSGLVRHVVYGKSPWTGARHTDTRTHTGAGALTQTHTLRRPTERLPAPTQRAGLLRSSSVALRAALKAKAFKKATRAPPPPALQRAYFGQSLVFPSALSRRIRCALSLSLFLIFVSRDFPSGSENSQI